MNYYKILNLSLLFCTLETAAQDCISNYPYIQDFETAFDDWSSGGLSSSWEAGTPNGVYIYYGPPSTPNSLVSWTTDLIGSYNTDENSWLESPCFDFTDLIQPYVNFDIWWDTEGNWDGTQMEYSLDDGQTWTILGNIDSGENWYNWAYVFNLELTPGWTGAGETWKSAFHDLSFLAGTPQVIFRFHFAGSDGEFTGRDGVAIDNFRVSDQDPIDVGVIALISPQVASVDYPVDTQISVSIKNFGIENQGNFPIRYSVNNGTTYSTIYSSTLIPGEIAVADLDAFDFSADGSYNLKVWTDIVGEMNYLNDTLEIEITNSQPVIGSGNYLIYSNSTGSEPFFGDEYEEDMNEVFADEWSLAYFETLIAADIFNENTCFVYIAGGFQHAMEFAEFYSENIDIIESWVSSGGHLILNVSPAEGNNIDLGFNNTNLIYPYYTYNGTAVDISHPVFNGSYIPCQYDFGGGFIGRGRIEGDLIPIFEDQQAQGHYMMAEKLWGSGKVLFAALDKYVDWYAFPQARNLHLNMLNYMKTCGQVDIGAKDLVAPLSGCGFNELQFLTIVVQNFGDTDAIDVPVYYLINNGDSGYGNIPLIPGGEFVEYTIPIGTDLSETGVFSVDIWTGYFGDADITNDTITSEIIVLATPIVNLGPDTVFCEIAILDALNPGDTYLWNDDSENQMLSINQSGSYSVVVTDSESGCTGSDSVNLIIENDPIASFSSTGNDLIITFEDLSIGATSWSWNFGDGFGSTESNPEHEYEEAGEYVVTLTIYNTCGSSTFSSTIIVVDPNSIFESDLLDQPFTVYPNPFEDVFFIESEMPVTSGIEWQILDLRGSLLMKGKNMKGKINSIEAILPPGMYILNISHNDETYPIKISIL